MGHHARATRVLQVTNTKATMKRPAANARRAACTTGTSAAERLAGRGGRGSSSRWVFSIVSMHVAVLPVRFQSWEASWVGKRRKRRNRKPVVPIRILLGLQTSTLCILPFIEAVIRCAQCIPKRAAFTLSAEFVAELQR